MRKKEERIWQVCNLILFGCCMAALVIYDIRGGLWRKGITSGWFLLLGLVNLCYARRAGLEDRRYSRLIVLGLFFGMCADVLLGVNFLMGVASFALGHVMYLIGFFILENPRREDLYAIIPIGALSLYLVMGTPFIRVENPMLEKLLLGYALIISAMLGKAISNFAAEKSTFRGLVLLGSAMFWFSDLVLAVDMFGTSSRLTWILCSYVYWPAQCVLGYSLFHDIRSKTTIHDP